MYKYKIIWDESKRNDKSFIRFNFLLSSSFLDVLLTKFFCCLSVYPFIFCCTKDFLQFSSINNDLIIHILNVVIKRAITLHVSAKIH